MAGPVDLYRKFELEVRTPKKRILLDAFLPAPETLEPSIPAETPPPLPVPDAMTPEEANMFGRRERIQEEEAAPQPKPRAKKKPKKKDDSSLSLQDEIAEFMNRDRALAPDDDFTGAIDKALEPAPDPEKKD